MKFKDLFETTARQSGISEAETEKVLQSMANVLNVEIPEEYAKKMTAEKLTLEAAKSHPDIHKSIKREVLDGMDREVKNLATKFEFTDDDKLELDKADTTYKRMAVIADKIKDKTASKSKATGEKSETLQAEIDKLNSSMRDLRKESDKKVQEIESARKQDKVNWNLDSIYRSKDYVTDELIGKDTSILTAKQKMSQYMKDEGVTIEATDDGNIVLKNSAGLEYFDKNNNKLNIEQFITKGLLESKMLKVSNNSTKPNEPRVYNRPNATNIQDPNNYKQQAYDKFHQMNAQLQEEAALNQQGVNLAANH